MILCCPASATCLAISKATCLSPPGLEICRITASGFCTLAPRKIFARSSAAMR